MKKSEFAEYYKIMFSDYPEMLKCCEVQTMLGVSRHAVYRLLKDGCIRHLRIGKRMIPREPPPIEYRQMINELRAIGNAMNQIAARANATGFFLVEEYAANAIRLANTVTSIREAVCMPDRIT